MYTRTINRISIAKVAPNVAANTCGNYHYLVSSGAARPQSPATS